MISHKHYNNAHQNSRSFLRSEHVYYVDIKLFLHVCLVIYIYIGTNVQHRNKLNEIEFKPLI